MAYWLLKTEPDEFSIDQLKNAPEGDVPWNGIRNYQARNLIRDQIQADDLAFIYHSSCKHVGVVGIAKIVKTAYPDPDQFDPSSPYVDPKSSADNPRWLCMDIRFVARFNRLVALATIKNTPALAEMVLVKQGRLSIQPVTPSQWQIICEMAGYSAND